MKLVVASVVCTLFCASANAATTSPFRGEFEITGMSGTCVDGNPVGTAGELRFQQFDDGTGLVFAERSQVRSYFLPSGTFSNTFKPVQTTFMRYGFGPLAHTVSVRFTSQVPANILPTTTVIHLTGEVSGFTPGCTATFLGELATWIK